MRNGMVALLGGAGLGLAGAGACAVRGAPAAARCVVSGGEKLPAALGGAAGVCSAIERAVARAAPGVSYRVEVAVPRPFMLRATMILADGRRLPERTFTVSDAPLSAAMVERFGERLGAALKEAVRG